MICNNSVTIYHKTLNATTRLEEWTRYNFDNVWFVSNESAMVNNGYDKDGTFNCRIPYELNPQLNADNLAIGDIVIEGTINTNITTQQDLSNYKVYNITKISDNKYGNNPHIHISG